MAFRAVRRTLLLTALALLATATRGAAQTETTEYYGTDAVGSVRIVFDASGAVLGRQDYDPFGREILAAWGVPPERFGGQTTDDEAQQAYFHARQLQSRTGRFASADPLFNATADPQVWNRYAYARNNPLSFSDYTGLDIFCEEVNGSVICVDTGTTVPGGSPGFDGGGTVGGGDSPCALAFHPSGCGRQERDPHTGTTTTTTTTTTTQGPPTLGGPQTPPKIRETFNRAFEELMRRLRMPRCGDLFGGSDRAMNAAQSARYLYDSLGDPHLVQGDWTVTGAATLQDARPQIVVINSAGPFGHQVLPTFNGLKDFGILGLQGTQNDAFILRNCQMLWIGGVS